MLKLSDVYDPFFEKFLVLQKIVKRRLVHDVFQRQKQRIGAAALDDAEQPQKILIAQRFDAGFFQMKQVDLRGVHVERRDMRRIRGEQRKHIVAGGQHRSAASVLYIERPQQVFGILPAVCIAYKIKFCLSHLLPPKR